MNPIIQSTEIVVPILETVTVLEALQHQWRNGYYRAGVQYSLDEQEEFDLTRSLISL